MFPPYLSRARVHMKERTKDSVLVLITIILVVTTIWLWRSTRYQVAEYTVRTSLAPKQEVVTFPLPKPHPFSELLPWFYPKVLYIPPEKEEFQPFPSVEYFGPVTLPKQVYEGDSQNISVVLLPEFRMEAAQEEKSFRIEDTTSGKSIILQISPDNALEQFLEIELQAAALEVAGEEKQRRPVTLENLDELSYQWNCYFKNSGNHNIALLFRLVCSSDIIPLGEIEHAISVIRVFNLTKRQLLTIEFVMGIGALLFGRLVSRMLLRKLRKYGVL